MVLAGGSASLARRIEETQHAIFDVLKAESSSREQQYAIFTLLLALTNDAQNEYYERIVLQSPVSPH